VKLLQEDKQKDNRRQQSSETGGKDTRMSSREKAMWTRTTDPITITIFFKHRPTENIAADSLNSSRRFEFMHV
jgi:hypothetical protein